MKLYKLTEAYVQSINDFTTAGLQISLLDLKDLEKFPFILVVQSTIYQMIIVSVPN